SEGALWGAGDGRSLLSGGADIAGWGLLNGSGSPVTPTTANEATIPLASDPACESNVGGGLGDSFYRGVMICGSVLSPDESPSGVDTCQGDSGGPLVVRDGLGAHLVGLTSWGVGCATNLYGVYSRVDTLRRWINQEVVTPGICTAGPDAITNAVATRTSAGVVRLSWGPAQTGCAPTSYRIESDGEVRGSYAGGATLVATRYADGARAVVPITPLNSGVAGPTTNFAFTVLPDQTKPSRMPSTRVATFRTKAIAKWAAAADASGIGAYALTLSGNHRVIKYSVPGSSRAYTFPRLRRNTRYTFTIYALDNYGNKSPVRAVVFRTRR
ncbi:MAG: trypsin-like serine protease, partial [Thermoleophilia bacterium]|nr:trypsin-like serine protease [Thermoleophilia bacterium]